MRIIKILNPFTLKGSFDLIFSDDKKCHILKDNKKIEASLKEETTKDLVLFWYHANFEQKYIKISKNCITKIPKYEKFNPKKYLFYNKDLLGKNNQSLYEHYINFGLIEGRTYDGYAFKDCGVERIKKLPEDFDPIIYRSLHPDLCKLDDNEVAFHYMNHGISEKRNYKDYSSQENPTTKSLKFCPIFINHDTSLTGAPIFLYDLVSYLIDNKIILNPIIAEARPSNLFDNYNIKNKLYHYNDLNGFLKTIEEINPVFIYSNSLNLLFFNNELFKRFNYKTYFHMHESLENINLKCLNEIKNEKIFVVADKIRKQLSRQSCRNLSIFPPFIKMDKFYKIKHLSKKEFEIKNKYKHLDKNKLIIGMIGSMGLRKNFILFHNLAEKNPDYEFLWIGGDEDWKSVARGVYKKNFKDLPNFYHIKNTNNPYAYLSNMDYFFLTSLNDPCPIVVLESLLLNKKVIVVKDNIFYDHSKYLNKNNYILLNGKNNKQIIEEFKKLNLKKYDSDSCGENYIKSKFSKPKLFKSSKKKNNYLIFNYYFSVESNLNEIEYFINLINFFNANQKFEYNIIINIKTDLELDNNSLIYYKDKFKNKFKNIINLEKIDIIPNKGWDIGGLLEGVNYIFKYKSIGDSTKLAYLHNKSNVSWREELNKIFHCTRQEILEYDTVASEVFFVDCPADDLNREIMKKHPAVFQDLTNKKFKYIQGTIFITNLKNLEPLYNNYAYICEHLTDVDTINDFWISIMKNNKIFKKYYDYYQDNIYNKPIDLDSRKLVIKNKAKNYIELFQKFDKRGIPDCHFEHTLERYIGYLVSDGMQVKTI